MKNQSDPVNVLQDLDDNEISEMHNYNQQNCDVLQVQSCQALMIGVAWVTAFEKQLFQQFPYVIKLDCTMDKNNENRPVLVATGCDSNGKSFTVSCTFLPNQNVDFLLDFPECYSCSSWM